MRAAPLDARRQSKHIVSRKLVAGSTASTRVCLGERACLVDERTSTRASCSSASAFLTSTPALRAPPGADHIAVGVAKPSGTDRDDEHRHAAEQRVRDRGAGPHTLQATNAAIAATTTAAMKPRKSIGER
jgi:hypothetical protein